MEDNMAETEVKNEVVEQPEKAAKAKKLTAKKDFVISQNEFHRVIKAGDDISDLPAHYLPNMKTEGVL
jgi:hypothetical protein